MARTSKAEVILREAKNTVIQAEFVRDKAYNEFKRHEAVAFALGANYDALEKALGKLSPKSTSAPSAKSKSLLKKLEAQSAAITGGATGSATSAGASGD